MSALAMAHSFPMVRAGGLFILIMGIGVALGGLFPGLRKALLVVGGTAATMAIILLADALTRPLGRPTAIQIWALGGAILLETALIFAVVRRYRNSGERTLLLAILFVVGIHFIPMAISFGPLCALLGISAMTNAGVGLWVKREASLNSIWIVDGALKLAIGGLMYSV
jgi:hypothetical protein